MNITTKQQWALDVMSKVHDTRVATADHKGNIYTYNFNYKAKFFYYYRVSKKGQIALVETFKATKFEIGKFVGMLQVQQKKISIQATGTVS